MKRSTPRLVVPETVRTLDGQVRKLVHSLIDARFRLVTLLEIVETRQHFKKLGFDSFIEYLQDRVGRSPRWYEEHLLAQERLKSLPKLRKALDNGTLNPSCVIELTRVADTQNESRWIAKGLEMSYRDLKEEIRHVRHEPKGPIQEGTRKVAGWVMFDSEFENWLEAVQMARRYVGEKAHISKIINCIAEAAIAEFHHSREEHS